MFIPRTLAETEGGGGRGPWARALIVSILLAASLWAIMSANVATGQENLAVGDVAQTEIRAPISRSFVSESQTNAAREEAADQVATVYVPIAPLADIVDQQLRAYDAMVGGITSTLEQRDAAALTDEEVPDELNRIAPQLTDEQVERLSAISLIGWQRISDAGREVLEAVQSEEIRADEITDAREQLRTNITQDLFDVDRELAGDLAEDYVAANYEASDEQTEAAREAARNAVSDVIVSVEQGETIVRAGDRITQLHLETLDQLGLTQPRLEASTIGGNALIAMILASLLVGFLWRFEPQIWYRNRSVLLFLLALLGSAVAIRIAADRTLWAFVVPTSATVLLATILLNGAAGAAMAVALAVLAGVMNRVRLELAVYVLAGGAAALIGMIRAERLNAFVRPSAAGRHQHRGADRLQPARAARPGGHPAGHRRRIGQCRAVGGAGGRLLRRPRQPVRDHDRVPAPGAGQPVLTACCGACCWRRRARITTASWSATSPSARRRRSAPIRCWPAWRPTTTTSAR